MTKQVATYSRTAARLSAGQILARLRRVLEFDLGLHRPLPSRDRTSEQQVADSLSLFDPTLAAGTGLALCGWRGAQTVQSRQRADLALTNRVPCLDETVSLSGPGVWTDANQTRLWRYTLNYHDFLVDLAAAFLETGDEAYAAKVRELVMRWIEEVPARAPDAWDPYPTSRRLVSWVKSISACGSLLYEGERKVVAESLHRQALSLSHNLELDLLGNHLLSDAKGLVFAGICLRGSDAGARLLAKGDKLIDRCAKDQILPDGFHVELTPSYQAIVLEDLLDLSAAYSAADLRPPASVTSAIPAMWSALAAVATESQELLPLGDTVTGYPASVSQLLQAAPETCEQALDLPSAGYCVFREPTASGVERLLLFDYGDVGYRRNPAHGHADQLGFLYWVAGSPVLWEAGTSTYERDGQRAYERSSAAHNAISVDGHDCFEVWDSFRVGRSKPAQLQAFQPTATGARLKARSASFSWLRPPVLIDRELILEELALNVTDGIESVGKHTYRWWFHFPPGRITRDADGSFLAELDSGIRIRVEFDFPSEATVTEEVGTVSRGWNQAREAPVLAVSVTQSGSFTTRARFEVILP